ncbi:YncE family protein [Nocardia sp. NPDC058658]|uniref:YncE family protein n=1 Tax=Nocardia sp. NPDC058658 TaxID=3346580 RepID=UPI00364761C7
MVAVVVASGCASPTPIATPTSTVVVTTTTDPATNRNYTDIGVGPYRARGDVQVGDHARNVAIDSGLHRAYAVTSEHTLDIIDTRTLAHLDTIELDKKFFAIRPQSITIDPVTHLVYLLGHGRAEALVVIDPATFTVTATFPVGRHPQGIAIDPETRTVFVTDLSGKELTFVDIATRTVGEIPLGEEPSIGVAVDPGTHTVFVTSGTFGSITMIDTKTRKVTASRMTEKESSGGRNTQEIAVDLATHEVFVTHDESSKTIDVLTPA